MSGVENRAVAAGDSGVRLDRWFKRHYPGLNHNRLEKLLRTGQIRVDGGRVKANTRLNVGQNVRVPPLPASPIANAKIEPELRDEDARDIRARVLYRDALVIVLNKPAGLATQGGTKQVRNLDDMLSALKFDASERPRLVHRLDKDTSGVLLLGRGAAAAAKLAEAFRQRSARKIYWALVVGAPVPPFGRIDLAVAKISGPGGERMMADDDAGKRAVTLYRVMEKAGRRAAWLALMPITGRTHQLRVHCAAMGTPIVGDAKYGGAAAIVTGAVSRKLHLHARSIELPHPSGGRLNVMAPLPSHMAETWRLLGFDMDDDRDPFADVE